MQSRFLVLVLVLVFLAACSSDRSRLGPVVRAEKRILSSVQNLADSGETASISLRYEYPEILSGTPLPLADSLRRMITFLVFGTLDAEGADTIGFNGMAGELQTQYAELRGEFSDYATPWEMTRRLTVLSDSGGIVSLRFDESSDLGGAHGLETSTLLSFETEGGRLLHTDDLFLPGSDGVLAAALEKEFRHVRRIAGDVSLSDAGFWVEEGQFPVTGNFAALPGEVVFYYAPYEIGPYAVGPTEVRIPTRAIREILRPNGLVR